MSGLETAIRNALDRSDRANPEIRARIYQSARQALEAGLRKQDITDVATVSTQRHRLEETIRAIEGEERARLHAHPVQQASVQQVPGPQVPTPQVPVPPVVRMEEPARRPGPLPPEQAAPAIGGETRDAPPVQGRDAGDLHAEPEDHLGIAPTAEERAAPPGGATAMDFKPEAAIARRKPRKIFARLLVFSVVLAFVGMGAWWVYSSGLLLTAAQRDTSVANPPPSTDPEDFDGTQDDDSDSSGGGGLATIDPQNSFSDDWVQIYAPGDDSAIKPGSRAKVEKVSENDGPAVRITSASGGDDGSVSIEIPARILQELAGKTSTFALTLQSSSDVPTQITVACDFQSLGDCGRHRFRVDHEKSDQLFQVRFDRSLAPTSAGHLLINSDVEGKGRGINVFGLRVLPGQ